MHHAPPPAGSPLIALCLRNPGPHRRLSKGPQPQRRLSKGPQGSTSGVCRGRPSGSAGQDDVAHPRAHSHQELALKEPPLQGVSPPSLPVPDRPVPQLPDAGPGYGAVTGAGPHGWAEQAWLPQFLLLCEEERHLGFLALPCSGEAGGPDRGRRGPRPRGQGAQTEGAGCPDRGAGAAGAVGQPYQGPAPVGCIGPQHLQHGLQGHPEQTTPALTRRRRELDTCGPGSRPAGAQIHGGVVGRPEVRRPQAGP